MIAIERVSLLPHGVMGLMLCVAFVGFAWFKRKASVSVLVKRFSTAVFLLLFSSSLFVVCFPTAFERGSLVYEIVLYYYRFVEPNEFNRSYYMQDKAKIFLPSYAGGDIATNIAPHELWVELSSNGRISIHNATLTRSILTTMVKNRVQRNGDCRVLIWADKDASTNDFNHLVQNITTNGCSDLYRVVSQSREDSEKVDFKVIRIENLP